MYEPDLALNDLKGVNMPLKPSNLTQPTSFIGRRRHLYTKESIQPKSIKALQGVTVV